jgi:hypothetical protein
LIATDDEEVCSTAATISANGPATIEDGIDVAGREAVDGYFGGVLIVPGEPLNARRRWHGCSPPTSW